MKTLNLAWPPRPESLELGDREVHVIAASLDLSPKTREDLGQGLSAEERKRAARIKVPIKRERFIAARATLRSILGRYLGARPSELRFLTNEHGKPEFADGSDEGGLQFNLSHSDNLAIYAVTRGLAVGIDVERIRPLSDERIAERYFSRREVESLQDLPRRDRLMAFYECWTRKEAYIKAKGRGLSIPLDEFEVSLGPGRPAELIWTQRDPDEPARWLMERLSPAAQFVGALAVEDRACRPRCWRWTEA